MYHWCPKLKLRVIPLPQGNEIFGQNTNSLSIDIFKYGYAGG